MKRGITLALTATLGAALLLFGGCNETADEPDEQVRNVYAMGAVSTVKLLINQFSGPMPISNNTSGGVMLASYFLAEDDEEEANELENYMEKFDAYLDILDSFFGDRTITANTADNDNADYNFERRLDITGVDLSGEEESYTLYFTEGVQKSQFDEEKVNEIYSLDGVMCMYGLEITVRSERTYKLEEGQKYKQLAFRAYPYEGDRENYIEMAHDYTNSMTKTDEDFVYSVVVGGSVAETSSFRFERTTVDGTTGSGFTLAIYNGSGSENFEISRQQSDEQVMLTVDYDIIDFESGDLSGEFYIVQTSDGYEYSLTDKTALKGE
jgi:hypothetical protein